ncbi:MAG: histidine kinase [Acidobacteriia bacterium]|nr:histidine kinase [Terriglobia bacterium]
MHPLLTSLRRLLLYVLAWAPVFVLLVMLTSWDGTPWPAAAANLGPACRARPLRLANAAGLLATFGSAAVAAALIFAGVARMTALALGKTAVADRRLSTHLILWFGMGVLLYLLSSGLHYAGLAMEASHEAERRAGEARTLAREAELQALRMQINPHFLFNSLHSIAALATQDGRRAREMCIRLADFLRNALALSGRETISLSEELALAKSYLDVEHVRFGERLRVKEQIEPACGGCSVPALLLQPLVENAVKHGVAGMLEGAEILLAARRTDGTVEITLENAFDAECPAPSKTGLGLRHVRRRLQVRYGEGASLATDQGGGIYRVILRLPCE